MALRERERERGERRDRKRGGEAPASWNRVMYIYLFLRILTRSQGKAILAEGRK
jgi:hypothetical protein